MSKLFDILWLDEVTSTNDEAMAMARAGHSGDMFVAARGQTGGRGRRGRSWSSPPGNLYCSCLIRPDILPERRGEMAFVAALAMRDAVADWTGRADLALKWPNDLLLCGRKIGGILIEADHDALVVGMGLNIRHFPEGAEYRATSLLQELGEEGLPTPEVVLEKLASAMQSWLLRWRGEGFGIVRSSWLEAAAGLGKKIVARLPNEEISGIFLDLDPRGALMLSLSDNTVRRINAGAVFFQEEP